MLIQLAGVRPLVENPPSMASEPESKDGLTANGTPKLVISLATFNEVDNLRPLVESIREFAPYADVLVIDDNSPDGTGRVADELKAELPGIHVIHRSGKLGLGTAVLQAMEFAIKKLGVTAKHVLIGKSPAAARKLLFG